MAVYGKSGGCVCAHGVVGVVQSAGDHDGRSHLGAVLCDVKDGTRT